MSDSPWKPAWTPKRVDEEEITEEGLRRRVAQHVQEAKIALDSDKQERKKAAEQPLEKKNDCL